VKLAEVVTGVVLALCLCVEPGAGSAQDSNTYVPDKSQGGTELKGAKAERSSLNAYVPHSLKDGERVRGMYQYTFNQTADSFVFRDFAERAKMVIAPTMANRGILVTKLGLPELERIPVTHFGHSAGGHPAWSRATAPANIDSSLAVIAHHAVAFGAVYEQKDLWERANWTLDYRPELRPSAVENDKRGQVPVWNIGGARDKHWAITKYCALGAADASSLGWKWTFALGQGESHQHNDLEALKLQLLWLEDVGDLRIKDPVPRDGAVTLQGIDETKCWVGYIELIPPSLEVVGYDSWRVANVAVYPYDVAPGRGAVTFDDGRLGGYCWLPSQRFARAWLNYHRTASIEGDASPRIQTAVWIPLSDTGGARAGWGLFQNHWCRCYVSALNLPDFKGDMKNVTWDAVGDLPAWLSIDSAGRIMTQDPQPGTYKFRLRVSYGQHSWEDDFVIGLRAGEDDSALKLEVESPNKVATGTTPLTVRWTSSLPLGILQWHSNLDGDLGIDCRELGTTGSITMPKLSPGNHLITLLAYSSPPQTHRTAVSFPLTVVADGAPE
jgi:hypothetical protein